MLCALFLQHVRMRVGLQVRVVGEIGEEKAMGAKVVVRWECMGEGEKGSSRSWEERSVKTIEGRDGREDRQETKVVNVMERRVSGL